MDFLKGREKGHLALHYVLGENEKNVWLAEVLSANRRAVTVIDPRYIRRTEIRNGISYTNMEYASATFDIPDKLYFYSYMDPMNRKL